MHDVLGVELEIEPRAAIGNDARGEQQLAARMRLALVVVEEHARAAVHLRDDHALGAVDDEGAVLGHERDVAHIDVLFLDVLDRLGAGFLVHIEHDEAQRHLERRGDRSWSAAGTPRRRISDLRNDSRHIRAARISEKSLIGNTDEKTACSPSSSRPGFRLRDLEELVVGGLLHLDEVRHFRDLDDLAEVLAKPFASREGECHSRSPLLNRP